jgi:hypothetical protein
VAWCAGTHSSRTHVSTPVGSDTRSGGPTDQPRACFVGLKAAARHNTRDETTALLGSDSQAGRSRHNQRIMPRAAECCIAPAVNKSVRLDADAASAAVPLREGKQQRPPGVEGACPDPAPSRFEQADGRRGGSSKLSWADAAPRCCCRPDTIAPVGAGPDCGLDEVALYPLVLSSRADRTARCCVRVKALVGSAPATAPPRAAHCTESRSSPNSGPHAPRPAYV